MPNAFDCVLMTREEWAWYADGKWFPLPWTEKGIAEFDQVGAENVKNHKTVEGVPVIICDADMRDALAKVLDAGGWRVGEVQRPLMDRSRQPWKEMATA